jgi:hypothetical protein
MTQDQTQCGIGLGRARLSGLVSRHDRPQGPEDPCHLDTRYRRTHTASHDTSCVCEFQVSGPLFAQTVGTASTLGTTSRNSSTHTKPFLDFMHWALFLPFERSTAPVSPQGRETLTD